MLIGVILGSLAVLSINSWPLIWLGFELNLIRFVPTVIKEDNNKKPAMIYFIIQSVGSIIILSSAIISENKSSLGIFILLGIMIKLGAAPLHFWVPNVLTSLNTIGLYIMIRWQKLAPIFIITAIIMSKDTISYLNLWTGSIIIISIARPIIVIIFSGIAQMGWMIVIHGKLLTFFIFIYFSILVPIVYFLKTRTKNFFLGIINAGGLPPFSGFIIKLKALLYMKKKMALLFVSARAVALSCYSRMILNSNYKTDKVRTVTLVSLVVGIV